MTTSPTTQRNARRLGQPDAHQTATLEPGTMEEVLEEFRKLRAALVVYRGLVDQLLTNRIT